MGEIADMMLDGTLDEHTGEYIGKPCGYPRTLQRKDNPVYGVTSYLSKKGISDASKQLEYMREFSKLPEGTVEECCKVITIQFPNFASFVGKKL